MRPAFIYYESWIMIVMSTCTRLRGGGVEVLLLVLSIKISNQNSRPALAT